MIGGEPNSVETLPINDLMISRTLLTEVCSMDSLFSSVINFAYPSLSSRNRLNRLCL